MDRPARVYYGPGETPQLKISASADFSFNYATLTLRGYLIDASN